MVYRIKAGISKINRIKDDKFYVAFDAAVKIKDSENKAASRKIKEEQQ